MTFYTDDDTKLPQELFDDIKKHRVEYWEDKRADELYSRFLYHKEKEIDLMTDKELEKYALSIDDWGEEIDDGKHYPYYKKIKTAKRLIETHEREELIEIILDMCDLNDEYVDYIVEVYMND